MKRSEAEAGWQPGQRVRVTSGPFQEFVGEVRAVNGRRRRLQVAVTFFGREMLLELRFDQVTRM